MGKCQDFFYILFYGLLFNVAFQPFFENLCLVGAGFIPARNGMNPSPTMAGIMIKAGFLISQAINFISDLRRLGRA